MIAIMHGHLSEAVATRRDASLSLHCTAFLAVRMRSPLAHRYQIVVRGCVCSDVACRVAIQGPRRV